MKLYRIILLLYLLICSMGFTTGQQTAPDSLIIPDSIPVMEITSAGTFGLADSLPAIDSLLRELDSIKPDSISGTLHDSMPELPIDAVQLKTNGPGRDTTIAISQYTADVPYEQPVPEVSPTRANQSSGNDGGNRSDGKTQSSAAVPETMLQGSPGDSSVFTAATTHMVLKADTVQPVDTSAAGKSPKGIPNVQGVVSFSNFFWAFILLIIGYLIIRVITKFMNIIAERSARLRIWLKGLIPIFRIIAWTIVAFIIIQGIFKPNWQTILALSASIGVAIGFAAQDILKNIFGGFTILAEKSFQVGDMIQLGEHYGEVLSIGFRSTKIVTADDSVVTLPNSELTAKPISNSNSGETNCQVVAEFYLPEQIDFEKVRRIATEAAQISGFVYLNKPITVLFFHELRENVTFIKMRLKAYVLDIRYEFTFKSQMTEIVIDALRKEKIIDPD